MISRIFRPKRKEVIGGWRKLYNEELHEMMCYSTDIGCSYQETEMLGA
jgi:hypothetical protein